MPPRPNRLITVSGNFDFPPASDDHSARTAAAATSPPPNADAADQTPSNAAIATEEASDSHRGNATATGTVPQPSSSPTSFIERLVRIRSQVEAEIAADRSARDAAFAERQRERQRASSTLPSVPWGSSSPSQSHSQAQRDWAARELDRLRNREIRASMLARAAAVENLQRPRGPNGELLPGYLPTAVDAAIAERGGNGPLAAEELVSNRERWAEERQQRQRSIAAPTERFRNLRWRRHLERDRERGENEQRRGEQQAESATGTGASGSTGLDELQEAGERLTQISSSLPSLLNDQPPTLPGLGLGGGGDLAMGEPDEDETRPRRVKRRRLGNDISNEMVPERKEFVPYGHYGQVVPGKLRMEIEMCDGGEFERSTTSMRMSEHPPENVLKNDSSVYCTEAADCNMMLRHEGNVPFEISKLVIKAPSEGFTCPLQEGLVFLSVSDTPADLLSATWPYMIDYSAPLPVTLPPCPPAPPPGIRDQVPARYEARNRARERARAGPGDDDRLSFLDNLRPQPASRLARRADRFGSDDPLSLLNRHGRGSRQPRQRDWDLANIANESAEPTTAAAATPADGSGAAYSGVSDRLRTTTADWPVRQPRRVRPESPIPPTIVFTAPAHNSDDEAGSADERTLSLDYGGTAGSGFDLRFDWSEDPTQAQDYMSPEWEQAMPRDFPPWEPLPPLSSRPLGSTRNRATDSDDDDEGEDPDGAEPGVRAAIAAGDAARLRRRAGSRDLGGRMGRLTRALGRGVTFRARDGNRERGRAAEDNDDAADEGGMTIWQFLSGEENSDTPEADAGENGDSNAHPDRTARESPPRWWTRYISQPGVAALFEDEFAEPCPPGANREGSATAATPAAQNGNDDGDDSGAHQDRRDSNNNTSSSNNISGAADAAHPAPPRRNTLLRGASGAPTRIERSAARTDELARKGRTAPEPDAQFFIEQGRSRVVVRFDPPRAARYVLLKLWAPHKRGNIDVEGVAVSGFAGKRFLPACELL
ncbi:hypothetical protein BDY21DRAFT_372029 [Lineolata rhizophorae]|uniref:Uncharacterized protein n=1 Tax=Lineolata rhizophorae TaxID=578093 RepID=A0A6A6NZV3_9PEZI|nr:hypothetical protein BDY21DRAFT_372029 [Lineolata rhizophorae]